MPKITGTSEVLADDANAVLGDVMTVEGPKRLRNRVTRARRYFKAAVPLANDLGLSDGVFQRAMTAIRPVEADAENLARTAVLPGIKSVVAGAVKGAIYGALLGDQKSSAERRIGGGAAGGAVSFPVMTVLAEWAKSHLAGAHGVVSPVVNALLDDVAHVGGATASVVAAGGEAADGALAGTAVVVGAHVLGWAVHGFNR
jgi:hypothetical protein